jgi:hypothetical protein
VTSHNETMPMPDVLDEPTLSFLDPAATEAYARLRLEPVPLPGLANSVPIQIVPTTISGRDLHPQ